MAFISLRQLLDHAAEFNYGVPAFNVNNLEQIQAIMEAAEDTRSPVILQASAGARKYAGEAYLRHMVLGAVESHPGIPVVLHQDHGASAAVCTQSIRSGFTSVMMDGSLKEDARTPSSYDYNVQITQRVCEMAHAIGTSHGAYKFTRQPTGDILDIDRIAQIHAAVPNTHLVMHGSSSVPQEWLAVIRANGGDIKETYGVPVEEIQRGIRSGVRKVNIDTDIRLAMTGAMRQSFSLNPGEFDPRKALIAAKKAAQALCRARFEAFGCAGHADRIVPIALETMVKRYH